MLLSTYEEPTTSHSHHNHLVFILLDAEAHGLQRTTPKPYVCDCGNELTPLELDWGDRDKTSWPNCKSWRDGGKKRCPDCNEYFSMNREQAARPLGYKVQPKSEYDTITDTARTKAKNRYGNTCLVCDNNVDAVHRIVPPRYYGIADAKNLAPLCNHHHQHYGHKFVDIYHPHEWHEIDGLDWESYVTNLRDNYATQNSENAQQVASLCEDLLENTDDLPTTPNPYNQQREEISIEPADTETARPAEGIKRIIETLNNHYEGTSGVPRQRAALKIHDKLGLQREDINATIDSLISRGELYEPHENYLKAL